jgi:UDP-N-acetyl-D-mannosaminuronic acid transferase (WecB/TagA/CpsF family)
MQNLGLEWLFRRAAEPRRLWRRYLLLGPVYCALVFWQWLGFKFQSDGQPPEEELLYG